MAVLIAMLSMGWNHPEFVERVAPQLKTLGSEVLTRNGIAVANHGQIREFVAG